MKRILFLFLITIALISENNAFAKEQISEYELAVNTFKTQPKKAIQMLTKLAKKSNIDAQIDLYSIYGQGLSTKKDTNKAVYWIKKAAQTNSEAMSILGSLYITQSNYKDGLKYLDKAAKKSNPTALYVLGAIYFDGTGVKQDCKRSTNYYLKAAKFGSIQSSEYFLNAYLNGNKCLRKSKTDARKWLKKAVKLNSPLALRLLGYSQLFSNNPFGVIKNLKEAENNLMKAANLGDIDAAYLLGVEYEISYRLKKDLALSVKLYQFAADNGHILAKYRLGTFYTRGLVVKSNENKACNLYEESLTYPGSAYNLATCYQNGEGRKKNLRLAHKYFKVAGNNKHLISQASVGMDYEYARGVSQNYLKARSWYKKAIQNSYKSENDYGLEFNSKMPKWKNIAKFNLSQMLYSGQGGKVDKREGFKLLKEAASSGFSVAQNSLGVVYTTGNGVKKDNHKAKLWFEKAAEQGDIDAKNNLKKLF